MTTYYYVGMWNRNINDWIPVTLKSLSYIESDEIMTFNSSEKLTFEEVAIRLDKLVKKHPQFQFKIVSVEKQ